MATWRVDFNPEHLYFITTRAVQAAHLFRREEMKQIVADSFAYMQAAHWLDLHAFVIMPNHVHLIVRCSPGHPVSDVVRDFKKHTSKRVIAIYKAEGNDQALAFLRQAVARPDKQTYAVWENDYQAKAVFSPPFLWQKMNYIHQNPLQPHWQLAERPEDYLWSSARFYLLDQPAIIPLSDARLLAG